MPLEDIQNLQQSLFFDGIALLLLLVHILIEIVVGLLGILADKLREGRLEVFGLLFLMRVDLL